MILKKTKSLWILSYMFILVLPILVNFVSYVSIESIMISQVTKDNQNILQEKMDSIDNFLNGMLNFSASCVVSDDLNSFAELSSPIKADTIYKMAKFTDEWSVAKNVVGVDNIYAYLPKSDFVLGMRGMNPPELFYVTEYGSREGYEKWKNIALDGTNTGFKVLKTEKGERILYVCIPQNSILEENRPVLVLEIDIQTLISTFSEKDGSFFIFDDNNSLIASTEYSTEIKNAVKSLEYNSEQKFQRIRSDGKDLIVLCKKSANSQWRYMYAIDRGEYMKNFIFARTITYVGIAISLLIGIILIRISVKRNHKPLEMLIERLQKESKQAVRDDLDDYHYINKMINDMLSEKGKILTAAEFQKKVLRDSVLLKLSKGYGMQKDRDFLLDSFEISFPHEMFIVGAIYVNSVSEIFTEEGRDEKEKLLTAHFVIRNVLEELLRQYFICYFFENDDIQCFIVNSRLYDEADQRRLEKCITETQEFVEKNFNLNFICSISDSVCGMKNIPVAFDAAMEELECRFFTSNDSLILKAHGIEAKYDDDYFYPLKKEQRIINAVRLGDYEVALDELDEVLTKNFHENHISVQLTKCLIFDILCTFIKAVNEIDTKENMKYLDSLNLYSRITKCGSVTAMRNELVQVLQEICKNINSDGKKKNMLIDDVINYVNQHYDDQNLSVSGIAEACSISPNYLSLIFKQDRCIGLSEYISFFRIEKAKSLLVLKPEMSIEEIAYKVGYSNVRTFVRAFKKYEMMTPTQYRNDME